jgi:hypothetical protein
MTASALAALVKDGGVSADELFKAAIERVEQRNPAFNAVVPGYLFIESLVTVVGSRFVDVNSRFLYVGSVFESQSAAAGEGRVTGWTRPCITFPDITPDPTTFRRAELPHPFGSS